MKESGFFLRVKHVLHLFLTIIFLWQGYSASSPATQDMSAVAGSLALLSALFSRGFYEHRDEATHTLIVSASSWMSSSKEKKPVRTNGKEHVKEENKQWPGD